MPTNNEDLTGQVFTWLTVLGRDQSRSRYWKCKCKCGKEKSVRKDHLINGDTKSCGCYRIQKKLKNLPNGKKIGRLTILSQDINDPKFYNCQCDCGNLLRVKGSDMRRGSTLSCGCLRKEISAINGRLSTKNLIGQRFGKLTVIAQTPDNEKMGSGAYWKCLCDCGNKISAAGYHLRRGDIQSCGCIRQLDITGQKFGKLTAIERNHELSNLKNQHSFWKCQCECGNIINVYLGHLRDGHTTSCGCDKSSKGEKEISKLLDDNNIKYIHDKQYFKDLILPSGGIGRYDYIIFNNDDSIKCIIEFDGEQHYRDGFFTSVGVVQENDSIKNQYAFKHNIPIIRIPYWEKNNLNIDILFDGTYELAPDMEEAQELVEENQE